MQQSFIGRLLRQLVFTCVVVTIFFNTYAQAYTQTTAINPPYSAKPTSVFSSSNYKATYQAFKGRKKLGSGERIVTHQYRNNKPYFSVSFTSIAKWLFLSDKRTETTEFSIDGNKIKSHQFTLDRSGTGPDKHYAVYYDYTNQHIKNVNGHVVNGISWQTHWLDPLSEQLQIELDLSQLSLDKSLIGKTLDYHFLNRKAQPQYRTYQITEITQAELPVGEQQVIKIRRIYPENEKKKIKEMWFAPQMNYMMVRMIKKDGSDKFDMVIQDLIKETPAPTDAKKPQTRS